LQMLLLVLSEHQMIAVSTALQEAAAAA
jgi:hypothetical protein